MKGNLLEKLEAQLHASVKLLHAELAAQFPEGSEVEVMLHSKQRHPSSALVVNHNGGSSTIRVRLLKAGWRGHQHLVNVHWRRCFPTLFSKAFNPKPAA